MKIVKSIQLFVAKNCDSVEFFYAEIYDEQNNAKMEKNIDVFGRNQSHAFSCTALDRSIIDQRANKYSQRARIV